MAPGRPNFLALDTRQPLPQGSVMSLAFGPDGRLWAGTQDGAAWFDGRDWTALDMPGREVSNYVEAVLPRKDGSVWFGRQDGGIAIWRQGAWTRHTRADGLPMERVNALAETETPGGASTVWAGTYGGGLCRFEKDHWIPWRGQGGAIPAHIWKLALSQEHPGSLWVCGDEGVVRLDGDTVWAPPGSQGLSVNAVLESRDEEGHPELWFTVFGRGVARFREGRLAFFGQKQGLPSDFAIDLAETRTLAGGRVLWFATVGGLVRWEAGAMRVYDVHWGLPTDTIYRLKADPYRPDGLWIGTHGAGVLYHRDGGWQCHDALSGLPGNQVLSLATGLPEGKDPTVLVGTHLGVARWNRRRWKIMPIPAQLQGNRINALAEIRGRSGRPVMWVGSLAGLGRLEGGRWTLFDRTHGLPSSQVTALLAVPGSREELWVGTVGSGLAHWVEGKWSYHSARTGLSSDYVLALAQTPDPDGGRTLWAGLRGGGLARFRKGVWRCWNRDSGFPNNVVGGLWYSEGPRGPRLWIGTQGHGLLFTDPRAEEPSFQKVEGGMNDPPPIKLIYHIAEDAKGRIYIATPQGIQRLTPMAGDGFRVEQFTELDGLPSSECTPALVRDLEGHMWVGTRQGATELDPTFPEPLEVPRPLQLSMVGPDGHEIAPGVKTLPASMRTATFLGTLLATPRARSIRFRSQLEGFEEAPSAWSPERSREFLNLPPGNYAYLLWARNDKGQVLGPLRREFRILPAFWETWTFRLAAFALSGMVIAVLVRWRIGAVTRQNMALESLVAQRTCDLAEVNGKLLQEAEERRRAERLKDEFLSVVSHELRTPLTAIRGALGLLRQGGATSAEEGQTLVGLAERNSLRLLALVNDLLDIQKTETGHLSLSVRHLDLQEVVRQSLETYASLGSTYQVRLQFSSDGLSFPVQGDPDRLDQVLANLLSNAAKFSPKGSTVHVTLEALDHRARVSIANEGPPIPEAFRSRIFQKFAQADGSNTRVAGGTGLGLAISKALVEAHGGTIGFTSDEQGTVFWFELPPIPEAQDPPHPDPGGARLDGNFEPSTRPRAGASFRNLCLGRCALKAASDLVRRRVRRGRDPHGGG